jgi:hypothetical protein
VGKIDVSDVRGRWEAFLIDVVEKPLPGVDRALVIAGSDRRGTVYGLYTLSVADGRVALVLVGRRARPAAGRHLCAEAARGRRTAGAVPRHLPQRRGTGALHWSREKFGGFNSQFYAKVFELILRLRGNYLWPAMWGNAFMTTTRAAAPSPTSTAS